MRPIRDHSTSDRSSPNLTDQTTLIFETTENSGISTEKGNEGTQNRPIARSWGFAPLPTLRARKRTCTGV
jgi:hypothetical protein